MLCSWMFCVNQLSGKWRKKKGWCFFFSFFSTHKQMSEFMFYGNKIWPSPPSLPPDGPCGERVIIWPISAREPESVDVGWAVRCHAKSTVPRSLNTIPFTCPLSLVLSLPSPLHHRLDLLQPPLPSPPPPRLHPGIDFLPPDKAWPGLLEYLDR